MKWIDINSPKSETVRKTAALKTPSAARREGLYLVEGLKGVEELLNQPGLFPEYLVAEQSLLDSETGYRRFLEQRLPADMRVYRVSRDIFERLSDTETPQGILAVVKRPAYSLAELPVHKGPALYCILENLQDPGNAGTILRTADAVGADAVIALKGTVDFYGSKVVRATMGSLFHLPPIVGADLRETVNALHAAGVKVYAAALGGTRYHYEADFSGPTAFLIGNEGSGLSPEAISLADESIMIPMPGQAESLNAAMAAGVLMYEALRQRKQQ